jgi:hypothetical protein
MANHPPQCGPSVNTPLGNVSLTGTFAPSSVWSNNVYSASTHSTQRVRAACHSDFIEVKLSCDGQQKGSQYVLAPRQAPMAIHIRELVWEVFVTPPETDLEDLVRDEADLRNRPMWETPAGLFLAGVFSFSTPTHRWFSSPLSSMCRGPLQPEAQHVMGVFEMHKPFLVPQSAVYELRIDVRHNWRPAVPVTLRCTINSDLANQIEFG